jgi:hypothetical protein
MADNENTFQIGLCMAGAISAGAYTAGAMDYLVEALDDWQAHKKSGEDNVPTHNVSIPVMGGASAGGMTAIIAAAAIQGKIEPVKKAPEPLFSQVLNNKFYHSWVDLTGDDMMSVLLDTSDIEKHGLESALNAEFIDRIAKEAITVPADASHARNYISKNLKVFVTLSNLGGMSFSVTFKANTPNLNKYIVNSHNDYACFMLVDDASGYQKDGWIPLNFQKQLNTPLAMGAAMATGAFPVGLKARGIDRDEKYLNDLDWFEYITKKAGNPFKAGVPYSTLNIDGGMINNEPFENVRKVLTYVTGQKEKEDYESYDNFKSTVLMIDPFPSQYEKYEGNAKLMKVVGDTFSALVGQSRVKPSLLIDAMDSNNAGQFLIAPVRYQTINGKEESIEGPRAIACGSLDGFGGFISKEFRIHDYFLGRANCEKFLRDHFTVPANTKNNIFKNGYSGVDKTQFTSRTDGGLQIIPIFTKRDEKMYMPIFKNGKQWPTVSEKMIYSYRRKVKARVQSILMNIAEYNRLQTVLLWLGAKIVINGKLANSVLATVTDSMKKHKLLEGNGVLR